MPKSYHCAYKYLILYIVLSFIANNKYFINCQKIKNKMKFNGEMSNDVLCDNGAGIGGSGGEGKGGGGGGGGERGEGKGGQINSTDLPPFCNHTALAQKRNFQDEKHSHGVTCYTCVNVSDNHICNKYAIDKPCKFGNDFCHTLHIMDPKGKSILVNKKCANETECTPHTIGCYHIDNQKICISCCDEDYCNKKVPTQKSNATFKNLRTFKEKLLKSNGKNKASSINGDREERSGAYDASFRFMLLRLINPTACYLFQLSFRPR